MTLEKWLKSTPPHGVRAMLARAKTSRNHLNHLISGRRRASAELAARIDRATRGAVKRETLCEACKRCEYTRVRS